MNPIKERIARARGESMKERPNNTWLSIGAFARAYGISRNTVYKWLDANVLEVYRFQGVTRIRNRAPEAHQPMPAVDVQSGS